MGYYATVENVTDALPTQVSSSTSVTSARVSFLIDQAESVINGKLAKAYEIPVVGSKLLETLATDMASYRLLRSQFTQQRRNESEWPDSFKEASETVDKIAKGEIDLVNSTGTLITRIDETGGVWTNNINYNPTMDEGDDSLQFRDPDKLRNIYDDKDL